MALTFKGERTVAELNNNLGGFVKDSAFRIYDHGTLLKGNVPVKHGDFVSWTGTQWKIEPSLEYATNADVKDIKDVIPDDASATNKLATQADIAAIGKPFQWKGPATVEELNTGISGIQPGWTYTLTDAGTLTDGDIKVDVGDEVVWTEDDEWFKLGGDGGVKVFQVTWNSSASAYTWPSYTEVQTAVTAGRSVVLVQTISMVGSKVIYNLRGFTTTSPAYYAFTSVQDDGVVKYVHIKSDDTVAIGTDGIQSSAMAPDYSTLTFPIAKGTKCMYQGGYYVANTDIATEEDWMAAHWDSTSVSAQLATIRPDGVFIGSRKIHPGSKLFVEGLPVDGVDYALVEKYNAFIYNRITALATSGTVTLGLWNYDTKTYVSEQQLSTDSDNPTVIDISAANASDTMEVHLKGTGTVDSIIGSIV